MKSVIIIIAVTIFTGLMLGGCSSAGSKVSSAAASAADAVTETVSEALTVSYIDVGKGDCILVQKGDSVCLIDAGYEETAASVIQYLKENGIEYIDYFIVTHYDKDHVGGAAAIAQSFGTGQIWLPDYEGSSSYYEAFMEVIEEYQLNASAVSEDVSFDLDGVSFEIFASDVDYVVETDTEEGNDNDVSLVVSAVYGEDSFLFAGDIEKEGITAYLEKGHGTYDVIKMPHHGSKAGNTDELIAAVNAEIAVITDSEEDAASDKVLEMLAEADTEVYRTSINGTIVITGTGTGEYTVTTEK